MYKSAWGKIINAKSIVLVSHIHPDGDTLGANLALYHILKGLDKRVMLFNATKDELPREFDFLAGYTKIQDKLPKFYDLIVSLDCASFDRLGLQKEYIIEGVEIVNIDHHKSNSNYGDENVVLGDASSAGMVLFELLENNNIDIPKLSAEALYTSIADDTDFFRYGGIGAKTFKAASTCIECGADSEFIASRVKSRVSLAKSRLVAFMLGNFELHCDASIASISIDKETLEKTGAKRSDTKNIVSMLRDIVNVDTSLMVLEQNGYVKVSLRSDGKRDVSLISADYGGGGHKGAAGFNVYGKDCKAVHVEIIDKLQRNKKV